MLLVTLMGNSAPDSVGMGIDFVLYQGAAGWSEGSVYEHT